jgi:hypothetical protein
MTVGRAELQSTTINTTSVLGETSERFLGLGETSEIFIRNNAITSTNTRRA